MKLRWNVQTVEFEGPYDPKDTEQRKLWKESCNGFVYEKKCETCDKVSRCYTQEDQHPEYYTDVVIECGQCQSKVWFSLPVN